MVRIKMPLKLIEGEKHRNSTFMKRRVVIKKKAMELGKLCDIATLLVCFGPRGQLETWPDDQQKLRSMIEEYRRLRPDECIMRRYDLATFFECHLKKLQAELARERESWLDSSPAESLEELVRSLDAKLVAIEGRIGHLGLEGEIGRGKEIQVWDQDRQNQLQHTPEGMPPLPLGAILEVQPIQTFEGPEFSRVNQEKFKGKGLQGHATAAAWVAPQDLQTSQMPMPCTTRTPPALPDPYVLPMVPDHGFCMDMSYLDDLIFPSPFLALDFDTYPAGVAPSTRLVVDALNPTTTALPLSFPHDAPLGYDGGGDGSTGIIRNSDVSLPPFDQPVLDARCGFSLHRLPDSNPGVTYNEVCRKNEFYGGSEFVQGAHTAGPSLAEAWSASIFLDLPPAGFSGSDSVQPVALGGDGSSKFVPNSATNPDT